MRLGGLGRGDRFRRAAWIIRHLGVLLLGSCHCASRQADAIRRCQLRFRLSFGGNAAELIFAGHAGFHHTCPPAETSVGSGSVKTDRPRDSLPSSGTVRSSQPPAFGWQKRRARAPPAGATLRPARRLRNNSHRHECASLLLSGGPVIPDRPVLFSSSSWSRKPRRRTYRRLFAHLPSERRPRSAIGAGLWARCINRSEYLQRRTWPPFGAAGSGPARLRDPYRTR
jgi:hypothetical protein